MVIATVTNFGDTLGVQFPKSLLKNVLISENDDVELVVEDNCIIIKGKRHLTTKERIAAFSGTMDDVQLSETDWGKSQGKEV